jgi:hypothetical protein
VSQESTNRSFDELARALADGSISRRRALKLFAGTAIAALIPSTRAMAAITCPPGTVKICHVPQRADGTCRRGAAETRCVSPENAARHAGHPCDCCGGCGGTDDCREPKPRTCFSTSTTSTSTSTTTPTTTTTSTTSTSTTPAPGECTGCGDACGDLVSCVCVPTADAPGSTVCIKLADVTGQGCTSSSQCPTGRVCVAASCAGLGNFCAVRCTA